MNGIALSPLTMIRLPFLLGFFLLLTGSAPFADAASSGQEQGDGGVVHIGIQETLDPEFFVDTLGPTMRHLRKRFPHLRFHAETFSIAELSQAIQTKSISFFIADSGLFTFLASTEHADDLATRQNRFSSDPKSRSKPSRYSSENDVLIEKSVKYTDFFLLSIVYV